MKTVFLGISGHGYGHLSQLIPIANALLDYVPDVRFIVYCPLPQTVVAERLHTHNLDYHQEALDIGLIQSDPLQVDIPVSFRAYQVFHHNFNDRVEQLRRVLVNNHVDLVIADIPYLLIEAAFQASIPSVAIASLTWDKVIASYFDRQSNEVQSLIEQICRSQAKADLALHPVPSMTADRFPHALSVPPVLTKGQRLVHLRAKLGIERNDPRRLILVSLGGMKSDHLPIGALMQDSRFHWLIHAPVASHCPHVHSTDELNGYAYRDVIATVDGVVSKPGYGTAVEVVNHQLPFVFTCRGDFPDEPFIVSWLEAHARCEQIDQQDWLSGRFGDALQRLMIQPVLPSLACNGDEVAADMIFHRYLSDASEVTLSGKQA